MDNTKVIVKACVLSHGFDESFQSFLMELDVVSNLREIADFLMLYKDCPANVLIMTLKHDKDNSFCTCDKE